MDVTILIPVLNRPQRVAPLVESIRSAQRKHKCHTVFIATQGDRAEILAIESVLDENVSLKIVRRSQEGYARKMNLGFDAATSEWVFLAADDLLFHAGWADEAIRVGEQTGLCVVGTNDLGNSRTVRGIHSTHTLVNRGYRECGSVDDPVRILHEGYHHNFVDDEFIQTAMWRDTYVHAPKALVEHLHPHWGKGQDDDTYRRGQRDFSADRVIYNGRRHLFEGEPR